MPDKFWKVHEGKLHVFFSNYFIESYHVDIIDRALVKELERVLKNVHKSVAEKINT